jgi:hypothetical protein
MTGSGSLEWCAICGNEMRLALHRDIWWSLARRVRRGAPMQLAYGAAAHSDPRIARAFEAHLRRSRVLIARDLGGDAEVIARTRAELVAEAARRGVRLRDLPGP